MTLLFIQAADTAHKLIDTAKHVGQQLAALPQEDLRFGDLLIKGGWVMIPIGILAVLGLVIFFERYFTIRKASTNESNLMMQVRSSIV
jgi:biopolymer transport protein ExbB